MRSKLRNFTVLSKVKLEIDSFANKNIDLKYIYILTIISEFEKQVKILNGNDDQVLPEATKNLNQSLENFTQLTMEFEQAKTEFEKVLKSYGLKQSDGQPESDMYLKQWMNFIDEFNIAWAKIETLK